MKRHLDIADYFSFLNVLAGFTAIILSDVRFIFVAGIMDGLDGFLARKGYSGKYGKYADSLADFVSFGVATAFFIPVYSLPYLLAGMYRLARFTAEDFEDFIGYPITSSSLAVTSALILFGKEVAGILSIILAFFMISNIIYRKIRNPILLGITAISIFSAIFTIEGCYAVLILTLLYLASPPFSGKLSKYF